MDGNNIRGREGRVCVRGGEQGRWARRRARCGEYCQCWLCFRVFPFPSEMTVCVMWRKSSGQTKMKTSCWSRINLSHDSSECTLL